MPIDTLFQVEHCPGVLIGQHLGTCGLHQIKRIKMGIFAPNVREIFLKLHRFLQGQIISLYNIIQFFFPKRIQVVYQIFYFIPYVKFKKRYDLQCLCLRFNFQFSAPLLVGKFESKVKIQLVFYQLKDWNTLYALGRAIASHLPADLCISPLCKNSWTFPWLVIKS